MIKLPYSPLRAEIMCRLTMHTFFGGGGGLIRNKVIFEPKNIVRGCYHGVLNPDPVEMSSKKVWIRNTTIDNYPMKVCTKIIYWPILLRGRIALKRNHESTTPHPLHLCIYLSANIKLLRNYRRLKSYE